MENKNILRKKILSIRSMLTDDEVNTKSSIICNKISENDIFQMCENICLYMPIRNEVNIILLQETILRLNKKMWLPRIIDGKMDFYFYDKDIPMIEGAYGIKEPDTDIVLTPDPKTLIIMPGAVFSKKCDRIGYGGGYYDKYLSQYPVARKLAVAYSFQIVNSFYVGEYDIKPEIIISETEDIKNVN